MALFWRQLHESRRQMGGASINSSFKNFAITQSKIIVATSPRSWNGDGGLPSGGIEETNAALQNSILTFCGCFTERKKNISFSHLAIIGTRRRAGGSEENDHFHAWNHFYSLRREGWGNRRSDSRDSRRTSDPLKFWPWRIKINILREPEEPQNYQRKQWNLRQNDAQFCGFDGFLKRSRILGISSNKSPVNKKQWGWKCYSILWFCGGSPSQRWIGNFKKTLFFRSQNFDSNKRNWESIKS